MTTVECDSCQGTGVLEFGVCPFCDGAGFVVLATSVAGKPIPGNLLPGLQRWRDLRVRPGSFLCAVLENDLRKAVQSADPVSYGALRAIVEWCWNELPADAWGSPEKMDAWAAWEGGPTEECGNPAAASLDSSHDSALEASEASEAAAGELAIGQFVDYEHPDWGPSRGEIILGPVEREGEEGSYVLVRDVHPDGGQEWWPVAELRREAPAQPAEQPRERVDAKTVHGHPAYVGVRQVGMRKRRWCVTLDFGGAQPIKAYGWTQDDARAEAARIINEREARR